MKNRYYIQHDLRDCAAACLATVLYSHNIKLPLVKVREKLKIDRNGASIEAILTVARGYMMNADAYHCSIEELINEVHEKKLMLPMIAHIISDNLQHYVVIKKINNKTIKYFDPIGKMKTMTIEHFSEIWTGYIVNIEKNEHCQDIKLLKKKYFSGIIKRNYKKILCILVLSIIMAIISIVDALFYQKIIDGIILQDKIISLKTDIIPQFNISLNLNRIFLILIIFVIFQAIITLMKNVLLSKLEEDIGNTLSKQFLKNVFHLPFIHFKKWSTGELLSRYSDMGKIQELLSQTMLSIIFNFIMLFIGGGILFNISKILFFITIITVVIYVIIMLLFKKGIENYNQMIMQNNEKVTKDMKEYIDGIETIKAYSIEKEICNDLQFNMRTLYKNIKKGKKLAISESTIMNIISGISSIAILWIGCILISKGKLTLGTLIAFQSLVGYFASPILELVNLQPECQAAIIAMERLEDIYGVEKEKIEIKKDRKYLIDGDIKFENVSYRYGFRPYVLKNVNLYIKKGTNILIKGKSGTEKTTLVNLLKGFLELEEGDIYIGEKNIKNISIYDLRNKVAYISQTPYFFSKTIYQNIVLNNSSISKEELSIIIDGCQLTDVIEKMPLGINTIISENGKDLSGGQKQRLSIARALVSKPEILIIDEGTNQLDAKTEEKIIMFIKKYLIDCTIIRISHNDYSKMQDEKIIEL